MIIEGTKVKVFKEKYGDTYHRQVEEKTGVVLKKYPNFYMILLEDKYRECFKEYELMIMEEENDNKDN